MTTRSAVRGKARRQLAATDAPSRRTDRARILVFGALVVAVLGIGLYLAFGDFLRRPLPATTGAISVQSSMAGFTPSEIRVKAGTVAAIDWWTDDSAIHLEGGVHTMIAPELDLAFELPAESRQTISFAVPDAPGTYDVYCDSCCGGRQNPTMHGTIVVEV